MGPGGTGGAVDVEAVLYYNVEEQVRPRPHAWGAFLTACRPGAGIRNPHPPLAATPR